MRRNFKSAFTLIELLVVLALVAVLSTVAVVTLNPAELLKQARDSTRISDLNTVNTALGTFAADSTSAYVGASSTVYVSLPDSDSACANLSLPTLPAGWAYKCSTADNYKKTDGTGWIPANLNNISFGNPLTQLPIDPKNSTSTGLYYTFVTTGSWWELTAILESDKYGPRMVIDGGASPNAFEQGTDLTLTPVEALDRGVPTSSSAPTLASISPTSTTAGDPQFTLTVVGTNFTSSSVVRWGASAKTTTFVSSTQLTAIIPDSDVSATGTIAVTVYDAIKGTSAGSNFAINTRTVFIAGSWTTESNSAPAQSDGAAIVEANGEIFVAGGYYSSGGVIFKKYNPSTLSWTSLQNLPSAINDGFAIVKYDNDTLFAFKGGNTTTFWKYAITANSWSVMASATANVGSGGSLSYPGAGDFIYAFYGGDTNYFLRYSVSNNNWGQSGTAQSNGSSIIDSAGKLYVTDGNSTRFNKYDPTTRAWSSLASLPSAATEGFSIAKYDNDTFFALKASNTTTFWQYKLSTNTWSVKASTTAAVYYGGSLTYPGTGDYLYAFAGGGGSYFWRYSVANDSWGQSGTAQGSGSILVDVSGKFYITNGNATAAFRKYDPSTTIWSSLSNLPSTITNGFALAKYSNDTLFALKGGNTTSFWQYTLSTDTWSIKASTTVAVDYGGSLCYPGAGDYIYAFTGAGTTNFKKYSIGGNSWSDASSTPSAVYGGGSLTALDSDTLYALASNGTAFMQYKISTGLWTTKTSIPMTVYAGGSLTTDGTNIYATPGGQRASFYKYSPTGNSWSALATSTINIGWPTNAGLALGGISYSASLNKIYAISGYLNGVAGSIIDYDVANDAWVAPSFAPGSVYGGGSLTALDSDTLYALISNGKTFWQYKISTGVWTAKTGIPLTVYAGGSLASDGINIYATPGGQRTSFYKYSPAGNSWSTLASSTISIGWPTNNILGLGGITYSPSLNKVFAINGYSNGVAGTIADYDIATDGWPAPAFAPVANVYGGASLTALNSDTLYASMGRNTTGFWQYKISTGAWTVKANVPLSVDAGGSLASDGTNIYALRGKQTSTFWKYSPAGNSWTGAASTTVVMGWDNYGLAMGGITYAPTLNAFFAIPGNSYVTVLLKNISQ